MGFSTDTKVWQSQWPFQLKLQVQVPFNITWPLGGLIRGSPYTPEENTVAASVLEILDACKKGYPATTQPAVSKKRPLHQSQESEAAEALAQLCGKESGKKPGRPTRSRSLAMK